MKTVYCCRPVRLSAGISWRLLRRNAPGRKWPVSVPHVMPLPKKDSACTGQIVSESLPLDEKDILVKVLQVIDDRKAGDVDIAGADVIVSGGRGMLAKENLKFYRN